MKIPYPTNIAKSPLKSVKEIYLQKVLNELVYGVLTIDKIVNCSTQYFDDNCNLHTIIGPSSNKSKWITYCEKENYQSDYSMYIQAERLIGIPITIDLIIQALKNKYKHLIDDESINVIYESNYYILKFMKYEIHLTHFDDCSMCLVGGLTKLYNMFDIAEHDVTLFKKPKEFNQQ
jgi:hypothetical protein